MKETIPITLTLKRDKKAISSFAPLLQLGFLVKTQVESSIKNLLYEQFKFVEDYLADRIATIFLDGKPLYDEQTSALKDDSKVALAIAMVALVGAMLLKKGALASFRCSITHQHEGTTAFSHEQQMVKSKLFSLLIRELGPLVLKEGIWLKKDDVETFLKDWADILRPLIKNAEIDGQQVTPEELVYLNWQQETKYVFLKAFI